ncbi:MAG: CBS domain-containing protein, partial [Geminicoccaceae bacterium]|nr:CBS domain-containing protein [Geminicoccaceae bacterium]
MPRRPVRDFLARDTLLKAEPEETVRDAAIGMAAHHCGSVLIARGDALVGIFTERDLLSRVVAAGRDLDTPLIEVMTANPDTIAADAPIKDAIRQMNECGYRHLPVIENDRVLGILSIRDLPFAEIALMEKELDDRQSLAER